MAKEVSLEHNVIKKNKIPILIYTPEWIQLFSNDKSRDMVKIIDALQEELSKEKHFEEELQNLEKRKRILLNKILVLSNKVNEEKDMTALNKMAEAQNEILDINIRMPKIIEDKEEIPLKVNEYNTKLLKVTVKKAYEIINDYKDESNKVQKEVNELREKLGSLIQKKVEIEDTINRLYSFLHGMIGASHMEDLDERFLKEKSKEQI